MTMDHNFQGMDMKYETRYIDPREWKILVWKQALRKYQNMRTRGALWRFWCRMTRNPFQLMDLSVIQKECQLGNYYDLDIQTIQLDRVVGSVGRVKDFDAKFFLRTENGSKQRWIRIAEMLLSNESIPAIDVIQVGDRYFVKDGHHRISVARALGMKYIEAQIRVMKVTGDLPWVKGSLKSLRRRQLTHLA